jgi:hypothetical protein
MTADVGLLPIAAAWRAQRDVGDRMGPFAEVATAVGVGGEVTTEQVVAEELDKLAATRALARPVPRLGADHAFKLGAAKQAPLDPS